MDVIKDLPEDAVLIPYGFVFGQELQFSTEKYGELSGTYIATCGRGVILLLPDRQCMVTVHPDQIVNDLERY